MSTISIHRISAILDYSASTLPDMWRRAQSGQADAASRIAVREEFSSKVTGLVAVLGQKVGAALYVRGGALPWQLGPLGDLVAVESGQLLADVIWMQVIRPVLENVGIDLVERLVKVAAPLLGEILDPIIGIVGAIPLYGWALEALYGLVMGIVDLAQLEKKQQQAIEDAKRLPNLAPNPEDDRSQTIAALRRVVDPDADLTALFMPLGDPTGDAAWKRGTYCLKTKTDGWQVGPTQDQAWMGDGPGFGLMLGTGGRCVRKWEWDSSGRSFVDAGAWLSELSALGAQLESQLWGISNWAMMFNGERAAVGWERFTREVYAQPVCSERSPEVRARMMRDVARRLGVRSDITDPEQAAADCVAARACREQRRRALWTARKHLAAAYVDPRKCDPEMREILGKSQRRILGTDTDVCRLDPTRIEYPVMRAEVELRQAQLGPLLCGPNTFQSIQADFPNTSASADPNEDPEPPPPQPPEDVPKMLLATDNLGAPPERPSAGTAPGRGEPTEDQDPQGSDENGSGALLVLGAVGIAATGALLTRVHRRGRS